MPPRKQPGSEQPALPGMAEAQPLFDPKAAFGRIPSPDYWGIDPSLLKVGLGDEDIARVQPGNITYGLFGPAGEFNFNGLNFSPEEYRVLVHGHNYFTRQAVGQTLVARAQQDLDLSLAAADRSAVHALEKKQDKITGVITGYDEEKANLERFLLEMRSPGYAHMDEIGLRSLAVSAKTIYFRALLRVLALNQRWSEDHHVKAQQALEYCLHGEDYRRNFSYWRSMSNVDLRYVNSKLVIARANQERTTRTITRLTK